MAREKPRAVYRNRQGSRAGEPGEMIAALPVLRLVIDDFVFDLHLPDAEIALEIGGIVLGIPEAELDRRKRPKSQPALSRSLAKVNCQISSFSSSGTK